MECACRRKWLKWGDIARGKVANASKMNDVVVEEVRAVLGDSTDKAMYDEVQCMALHVKGPHDKLADRLGCMTLLAVACLLVAPVRPLHWLCTAQVSKSTVRDQH